MSKSSWMVGSTGRGIEVRTREPAVRGVAVAVDEGDTEEIDSDLVLTTEWCGRLDSCRSLLSDLYPLRGRLPRQQLRLKLCNRCHMVE